MSDRLDAEKIEQQLEEIRRLVARLGEPVLQPKAVTLAQAAVLLSVHPRTINRMLKTGELLSAEVHGMKRITMAEIDRVLAAPQMKSTAATPERVRFDAAAAKERLKSMRKNWR